MHCFDPEDEFVCDTEELMDDSKVGCAGAVQETVLHREGHTVPRAKATAVAAKKRTMLSGLESPSCLVRLAEYNAVIVMRVLSSRYILQKSSYQHHTHPGL